MSVLNPAVDLPRDYDTPYLVACCLYNAAGEALKNAGLRVPTAGGVTHKLDGEFACEDCEGLWVWWDDTVAGEAEFGPKCRIIYERTFKLLLAWNVCTERLTPCYDPDIEAGRCETVDDGLCPDPPTPAIGRPGECDSTDVTVAEETAWIYAARYAIERDMPGLLCACLSTGCANIGRCKTVRVSFDVPTIEGGCSFAEFTVTLRW